MDGVIVNFVKGVARLLNVNYADFMANWIDGNYPIESHPFLQEMDIKPSIYALLNQQPADFWENLEMTGEATELLRFITGNFQNVYFLSTPLNNAASHAGKYNWIRKHETRIKKSNYIFTKHKRLLAKPNTILIDDKDQNCIDFMNADGNAILYPQRWNALSCVIRDANTPITRAAIEISAPGKPNTFPIFFKNNSETAEATARWEYTVNSLFRYL